MRGLGTSDRLAWKKLKSDTGNSLHTQEPVTVASFRTWRGWRECVAWDRCLTWIILALQSWGLWGGRSRSCWGTPPRPAGRQALR